MWLGCLSAVMRLQRGGGLSKQKYICQAAAKGGYLEKLKVLREYGCPWDEWTCVQAAEGGNLDILLWLRENDCPWDENTITLAEEYGHEDIVTWAKANGAPDPDEVVDPFDFQKITPTPPRAPLPLSSLNVSAASSRFSPRLFFFSR